MSRSMLLTVLLGAILGAAPPCLGQQEDVPFDNEESARLMQMEPLSGNLLSNGSFEEGRYWPFGWWPTDGLSTFWIEGGTHGKRCLRVYTAMQDEQWSAHEKAVRAAVDAVREQGKDPQKLPRDPRPQAPEPKLARPPYYSAVGGIHGVHYRSEYIPVQPGAIYRFSVDCRNGGRLKGEKSPAVQNEGLPAGGTGSPRVFIKGFFDRTRVTGHGERTDKANIYRAPMILDPCGPQWRRYARLLHPARSTGKMDNKIQPVEYLQVQLFAYWPVGNYYFDNVRLEIVGQEEAPRPEEPPAEPEPRPEPQDLGEDEFPVFE